MTTPPSRSVTVNVNVAVCGAVIAAADIGLSSRKSGGENAIVPATPTANGELASIGAATAAADVSGDKAFASPMIASASPESVASTPAASTTLDSGAGLFDVHPAHERATHGPTTHATLDRIPSS